MSGGAQPAKAPDPRLERSRRLVLEAALEELADVGYGAFTIESVAARSGVAKSTIYRHWAGKLSLIAGAFQVLHEREGPDLSHGTARERLERVVRHVAEVFSGSTFSACIPALIDGAERDPELRSFHHRFQAEARRPLVALIAEASAAQPTADRLDPEVAASAILGAIFYLRLGTAAPLDPERAGDLIRCVLGGE